VIDEGTPIVTDYQAMARDNLLLHFSKPQVDNLLVLERAEGPYVFDTSGNRYIDALSSLFCAQIGYSYGAEMAEVATRQLTTLPFNTNWATAHPAALELAEKISSIAPADDYRIYFTNGGSESVEAAWKFVREHYEALGQP
jgi:adenosylmethionine-8-amino-7-oxononanoate aminotransferase